jgi:hypothetical protein
MVNGRKSTRFGEQELGHNENDLSFHFITINHLQAGRISYRFRLDGGNWNYTTDPSANFAALPPGSHAFEVQSQNEDGVWSGTLQKPFTIRPPWWRSWWFYGLLAMAVGGASYAFFRYRTGLLKKELAIQQQITDLERKALQAQMNPHFIFNCLNSIQRLILEKDEKSATAYLTHFAKLLRSTLNASTSGEVSLQEEMDLLDNYLLLEKLRFKDAFHYEISADPSLDKFSISFPPMLIQPFVENALKHGMVGKEQGGLVQVRFAAEDGRHIKASITDNGLGLGASSHDAHKSLATSLTKRRLELINGSVSSQKSELVTMKELKSEEGYIMGTCVEVRIAVLGQA